MHQGTGNKAEGEPSIVGDEGILLAGAATARNGPEEVPREWSWVQHAG